MGEKAENMVIGDVLSTVRGGAQRACKDVGPGCCCDGPLSGVVARCPMTFMEKFL